MKYRRTGFLLTTSIFLLFAPLSIFAGSQENPLVQAIKLFDRNQFIEAEKILQELINEKSDNQMVNYFYGACRTENEHYGQQEILYLLKGSTGESPLKTDYYLGVQYHAQNRWDDAMKYYNLFEKQCTADEANELELAKKIEECGARVNPFSSDTVEFVDKAPAAVARTQPASAGILSGAVYPLAEPVNTDTTPETETLFADSVSEHFSEADTSNVETEPEVLSSAAPLAPFEFVVNAAFTYTDTSHFRTHEGLEAFLECLKDQHRTDSITSELSSLRTAYSGAKNASRRNELGQKIIASEAELLPMQRDTKILENTARKAENEYWDNALETEQEAFALQLQNISTIEDHSTQVTIPAIDTMLITAEVFGEAVPVTPAPGTENKDDLVFKIQIGAYSRGIPAIRKKQIDKLALLRKIETYTDDRGVVVYTTGNLGNYEDAVKLQNQVRQEGIEDAFVVPYFNGKRITLEEAKKIE